MATRDRSVNIGYSQTNVYLLYKKAKAAQAAAAQTEAAGESATAGARIFRSEDLQNIRVTRLENRVLHAPAPAAAQSSEDHSSNLRSLDDLRKNLDKLTDMHSKLRFMLCELEDLVGKKK